MIRHKGWTIAFDQDNIYLVYIYKYIPRDVVRRDASSRPAVGKRGAPKDVVKKRKKKRQHQILFYFFLFFSFLEPVLYNPPLVLVLPLVTPKKNKEINKNKRTATARRESSLSPEMELNGSCV